MAATARSGSGASAEFGATGPQGNQGFQGFQGSAGGGGTLTAEDASWPKQFFSDAGRLPGTQKKLAFTGVWPTFDGVPVGSYSYQRGVAFSPGAALGYYDLGSSFTKVLVWNASQFQNQFAYMLGNVLPTNAVPDSYAFWKDSGSSLYKQSGGAFGPRLTNALFNIAGAGIGWGCYVDGTANIQELWVRTGSDQPRLYYSFNDASYTSFRYISFQSLGANAFNSPMQIWAA